LRAAQSGLPNELIHRHDRQHHREQDQDPLEPETPVAEAEPQLAPLDPGQAAEQQGRRGAEEGGEIGAFYSAGLPWRTQNVGVRLDEYMPAGLEAAQVRVLPRLRFHGNSAL